MHFKTIYLHLAVFFISQFFCSFSVAGENSPVTAPGNKKSSVEEHGEKIFFEVFFTNTKRKIPQIDFIFLKELNGKIVDAREFIKSMGRNKFYESYIKGKTFFFRDYDGNEKTLTQIEFADEATEDGVPSLNASGSTDYVYEGSDFVRYLACLHDKEHARQNQNVKNQSAYEKLKKESFVFCDSIIRKEISGHDNRKIKTTRVADYLVSDFDGDDRLDLVISYGVNVDIFEGDKKIDDYQSPFLFFIYGNGEKRHVRKVGQKSEQLYQINPFEIIDADNDGLMDVLLGCGYYESDFYSVIKGNTNELLFKSNVRCYDCY